MLIAHLGHNEIISLIALGSGFGEKKRIRYASYIVCEEISS